MKFSIGSGVMAGEIHQCGCRLCGSNQEHPDKMMHHQMNLLLSRMDEKQRRWYAAVEANRLGHGGLKQVSEITGLAAKTIRRGQQELARELEGCPDNQVRLPGAGRPPVEKKTRQ
jgi:hypothetical protein